jgi:hypothetical protein
MTTRDIIYRWGEYGDEYDRPGVLGRMSNEPSAKIHQTHKAYPDVQ